METPAVDKFSVEKDKQERRKSRRYTLSLPVVVAAGQQSVKATSRDVSTGGVYLIVESKDNLAAGAELDLTLTLPQQVVTSDELVLVRAHGKAVRVDALSDNGNSGAGVAVVFETHHFLRSNSVNG